MEGDGFFVGRRRVRGALLGRRCSVCSRTGPERECPHRWALQTGSLRWRTVKSRTSASAPVGGTTEHHTGGRLVP